MKALTNRIAAGALALIASLGTTAAWGQDWRQDHPTVTVGVITSENQADRVARYEPVLAYLQERLGVEVRWRQATDYAGIIEGVKSGHVDLAYFGPASYAKAWLVTGGKVEPIAAELNIAGNKGYHSVVIVRADSPYQSVDDLAGRSLAFADPNSTSGHQAPRYFLGEAGYEVDTHFGTIGFSGSHENSVMALLNGTFDAAATHWESDTRSNMVRMEEKGMIEPGQWRIVWKSPLLPQSPWTVPTTLPQAMRDDLKAAVLEMPDAAPEAFQALTDGKAMGYADATHEEYAPIVRMIQANETARRGS